MWTDEQLLEQGWSREQIAQYRIEQEIETTPKEIEVPEATVEAEPEIQTPIVEPSSTTVDQPGISASSLFQDKTQTILIVCMMVIAPLSLYGLFTEGPEGPSGVSGEQERMELQVQVSTLCKILQTYLIVTNLSTIKFSLLPMIMVSKSAKTKHGA